MRRALASLVAVALLLSLTASSVSAAPVVQRVWRSSLGTHGKVSMTAYQDGTGGVSFQLLAMRPNASYTATIWSGTCAALGTKIIWFTGVKTNSVGAASTIRPIAVTYMNKVWTYARPGNIAVRFVYGASVVCGNLSYYRSTRVRIPYYRIDLPVVPGPSGYPYCNVAMYQRILWQPTEPGSTFIFAHARTGMFLPLLSASKVNNGAAMIGKLVYVYTNNSMMYTYKIVQVRRHVTSAQSAVGVTTEQLWLQTSEGPNFTYPKLIVIAKRIAAVRATYAASHPTPHIVHCT